MADNAVNHRYDLQSMAHGFWFVAHNAIGDYAGYSDNNVRALHEGNSRVTDELQIAVRWLTVSLAPVGDGSEPEPRYRSSTGTSQTVNYLTATRVL